MSVSSKSIMRATIVVTIVAIVLLLMAIFVVGRLVIAKPAYREEDTISDDYEGRQTTPIVVTPHPER